MSLVPAKELVEKYYTLCPIRPILTQSSLHFVHLSVDDPNRFEEHVSACKAKILERPFDSLFDWNYVEKEFLNGYGVVFYQALQELVEENEELAHMIEAMS